jgi:ATP-dependent DNA helicase Q4
MQKIARHEVQVLFLSPEKLRAESFQELIRLKKIPTVNFACVDEVHCISDWSHNFRYFMS